ncbi:hypothetical protein [Paenibacillus dakarensis]|nr:hypothetical protein [Paenibacillus dakarensis]
MDDGWAVRESSPVAVKIGKLDWNRLRRFPDFKGERVAPPTASRTSAG